MNKKSTDSYEWVCPQCNHREFIGYDFLKDKGEPVCPDCDSDMIPTPTKKIKKPVTYSWIATTANYCNRLVIALPPPLYKKLPKHTELQVVVTKI